MKPKTRSALLRSIIYVSFLLLISASATRAQYVLTAAAYSQNFDGLGTVTNANVTSGDLNNVNASLSGWYFYEAGGNTTITAASGTGNTGDTYNFGSAASTNRTLGGLRSGSLVPYFGFYFTNNTTATITAINITYTGETWRIGANARADRLDFQYSIDATVLSNGTWVDVNALDYQNNPSTTSSGSMLQSSAIAGSITGISVGIGASIFIRWNDFNASGSDDGMGINDFSFTVTSSGAFSNASDYFRSRVSGDWSAPASWESSVDGVNNWSTATLQPTSSSAGITVLNGHIITLASNTSANLLTVSSGGTLVHNSSVILNIINSQGTDFIVNGTYLPKGTQPVFASGATAEIRIGGLVRVDINTGAEADDFARNTNVLFKTGSVFQWNAVTAFESSNIIYFTAAGNAAERPIFRVTSTPAIGSTTTTTFNGKFESNVANFQFFNSGTKVFRDGLGGTGEIIHANDCGVFKITGTDAVIDGSLTLTLNNSSAASELEIANGAAVSLMNTAKIIVGSNASSGSELLVNGTVKNGSSNAVDLTYGHLTINGNIDTSSTGSFKAASTASSAITNITIGGSTGGSAGNLNFSNGFEYINSFTINRSGIEPKLIMGSNLFTKNLILTNGIIATGDYLFNFLNESGSGSALTAASYTMNSTAYKNSYLCTCDATGNAITTTDGSKGFRISNVGNTEIMFPVGTDFTSPNRMSLKNEGPVDDYTVVVQKGDIGNTPMPIVYRRWYVNEKTAPVTDTDSSQVSMKLYFTKQDQSIFMDGQDEVESGFDYTEMHLVHKTTENYFSHNSNHTDILTDNPGNYNLGTEMFGQYVKGTSIADGGRNIGLTRFGNAFGVINQGYFILPVKFISFTGIQKDNIVELEWRIANEINVDRYEIEYSTDAVHFFTIGSEKVNKQNSIKIHHWQHSLPKEKNNYYRIKSVDKDGGFHYSSTILIVNNTKKSTITINPNPVINHLMNLQICYPASTQYHLSIFNNSGKSVYGQRINCAGDNTLLTLHLPRRITCGTYYVVLTDGKEFLSHLIKIE